MECSLERFYSIQNFHLKNILIILLRNCINLNLICKSQNPTWTQNNESQPHSNLTCSKKVEINLACNKKIIMAIQIEGHVAFFFNGLTNLMQDFNVNKHLKKNVKGKGIKVIDVSYTPSDLRMTGEFDLPHQLKSSNYDSMIYHSSV